MIRAIRAILLAISVSLAYSQDRLESLTVEGSSLPEKTVLELSGLRIGANIDRPAIEAGCKRLEETGLFSSINFRYAPTPKQGYALTLSLVDQRTLSAASIDVPGVDESEVWQWLITKFPAFDRKTPGNNGAQQVIAHQIETHLGARLHGQKIVTKMEADFTTRKSITSFQPEHLPRIDSITFAGNKEMTSDQARAVLQKVAADRGYTDRGFRSLVENNLRPAYEERGLYRVQFPQVKAEFIDPSSVSVTVTVEEGAKYSLGDVTLKGEDLPADQMLAAAKFKKGDVANWTEIQKGIWEMERPLKRTGYFEAVAKPERVLHDDVHMLDLKIGFAKGPLYHFGQLHINGLSAELDAKARKAWEKNPGDPYDYAYPNDFLRAFSKTADLRQFKRYDVKTARGAGDHTMDVTLVFEPR
jgi:outer membrane protein assembly factor BamA